MVLSNITMNIYTHAVANKKRRAQQKVVEMILPEREEVRRSSRCSLLCTLSFTMPFFRNWL